MYYIYAKDVTNPFEPFEVVCDSKVEGQDYSLFLAKVKDFDYQETKSILLKLLLKILNNF